jgi:hypothetical protein
MSIGEKIALSQSKPNKACNGCWGFCRIFKHSSGFGLFPALRQFPCPPWRQQLKPLSGKRNLEINS